MAQPLVHTPGGAAPEEWSHWLHCVCIRIIHRFTCFGWMPATTDHTQAETRAAWTALPHLQLDAPLTDCSWEAYYDAMYSAWAGVADGDADYILEETTTSLFASHQQLSVHASRAGPSSAAEGSQPPTLPLSPNPMEGPHQVSPPRHLTARPSQSAVPQMHGLTTVGRT